jgi:hypothetical protein
MKFTFVFACEKIEERKIYLKLTLGVSKSRRLWFSPTMQWPLVDIEYDMRGLGLSLRIVLA